MLHPICLQFHSLNKVGYKCVKSVQKLVEAPQKRGINGEEFLIQLVAFLIRV